MGADSGTCKSCRGVLCLKINVRNSGDLVNARMQKIPKWDSNKKRRPRPGS